MKKVRWFAWLAIVLMVCSAISLVILTLGVNGEATEVQPYLYRQVEEINEPGPILSSSLKFPLLLVAYSSGEEAKVVLYNLSSGAVTPLGEVPSSGVLISSIPISGFYLLIGASQTSTSVYVFSPWGKESLSLPGELKGWAEKGDYLFLLLDLGGGQYSLSCVYIPSDSAVWNTPFWGPAPRIDNETIFTLWQELLKMKFTLIATSHDIFVFFPFGYYAIFSLEGKILRDNFNEAPAGLFLPQAALISGSNWSEALIPSVSLSAPSASSSSSGGSLDPQVELFSIPSGVAKIFHVRAPSPGVGKIFSFHGNAFMIWIKFPSVQALLSWQGGTPYEIPLGVGFLSLVQAGPPYLLPFLPLKVVNFGEYVLMSSPGYVALMNPWQSQILWQEQISGMLSSVFGSGMLIQEENSLKILVPFSLRATGFPLLPFQSLTFPYLRVYSYSGAWNLVPPSKLYFSLKGSNWSKNFSPPQVTGTSWAYVSTSPSPRKPLEAASSGSFANEAIANYFLAVPYLPGQNFEYSPLFSLPGNPLASISLGAGTSAAVNGSTMYVFGPEGVAKVSLASGKVLTSVSVPATAGCVWEGNFYYLSGSSLYEFPEKLVCSFSGTIPFSEIFPTPLGLLLLAPSSGKACLLNPGGKVLFSISLPGIVYSATWGDGKYFFLTPVGIFAYSPNGQLVWSNHESGPCLVFADGRLVLISDKISLISPENGQVEYTAPLPVLGAKRAAFDPFTDSVVILAQDTVVFFSLEKLTSTEYFTTPFKPYGVLITQTGTLIYGPAGVYLVSNSGMAKEVLQGNIHDVLLGPGRFVSVENDKVTIYGPPPLSVQVLNASFQVGKLVEIKVFTRNLTGSLCPAKLYISGEGALIYWKGKYYEDMYVNSSGVYVFNVTSFQAGPAKVKISAELPEGNFTTDISLVFFHGPPKELKLFLTQSTIKAGSSTEAVAVLTDQYGNPIQGAAIKFTVGNKLIGEVMTNEKGIAHVSVTETKAGNYTLVASFSSLSSTAKFTVLPGAPVSLSANVSKQIEAGSYATFRVIVKDAYGNPVPGVPVVIFLSGQKVWSGETDSFGTAVGAFKVEKPGIYVVRVQAGGLHYSSVLIVASARGKMEEISGPGNETEAIAGTMLTYTVAVYDRLGRPVSGSPVEVFVDGHFAFNATTQNGIAVVKLCLKREGTHEITLYSPLAGAGLTFYVIVVPNVQHVSLSANATWPKEAGGDAVIWLSSFDPYGNPVKELFTVKISGPHGSGEMAFYASGLRKIRFPVFVAGKYSVQISCGDKILFRSSFVVLPNPWHVVITPPNEVFVSGQNVTFPVSVYDIYHNPVPYANVTVSLNGQNRTYITPPSGTVIVSLGALPVGKYTIKITCGNVVDYVALTVFPGPPAKLKILFSGSIIAGVKVTLTAQVLDKAGNPEPFIPISNITSKDAECSLVQHYTDKNGTFEFTFYSTLAGPHVVLVNASGQILNATVWVNPAPGRLISVRMYNLNPQPGQLVTIYYRITDEYGNPIQGVLPQIVIRGVHYYLKSLQKTNKDGVGYATVEFMSSGFGSLKVAVNGYSSPPVNFVVGNKEKLMVERALFQYLPYIALGIIGAVFAGLYIYYQRIERLRSKFI